MGSDAHAWTPDDALARLASRREGLSEVEAQRRLQLDGPNALPAPKPHAAWRILIGQIRSVIVWLLLAAAGVALVAGESGDAVAIVAVLFLNTALGFFTEMRARRAMESLLRLQAAYAAVVRDGRLRSINARELVVGDVIQLDAGQVIPADARLVSSAGLCAVEATLTGESFPVIKSTDALDRETPLAERRNMVYQGTTVAEGSACAVVVLTGARTEMGRIGELAASVRDDRTPLERKLDEFGHQLVWAALGAGAVVAAASGLRGVPLAQTIETGIALAIAAVPEGLPVIATIALAVGVHRMASRQALIRRLPSVETLGSVTVVCTDKTGTLTAGVMAVRVLYVEDREITFEMADGTASWVFSENGGRLSIDCEATLREALSIGVLVNRAALTWAGAGSSGIGDPTEVALLVAGAAAGLDRRQLLERQPLVNEIPFSSARMLMATFHQTDEGTVGYVKGAPSRVLSRCTHVLQPTGEIPLDPGGRWRLARRNLELAGRGLRVLALARRKPADDERSLEGLTFVGFVGLIDPPAPGVHDTIRAFRRAGIRTVMLTGDQSATAEATARDLGMVSDVDKVIDGRKLLDLEDTGLGDRIAHAAVVARVDPEAKLAVVRALRRRGEIVAFLGDGVNDAPALRQADVGVAMGQRGSDVAKEAADIILLDDRFTTIGIAVEQGRVIFDNIRKFVFYLFSCNLAEVLVLLLAALADLPLPLLPLQILWINIVTDTFPALSLAIEPPDGDVMQRKPRAPAQSMFSASFVRGITWYALIITAVTLSAFAIGLRASNGVASLRALTMSFTTLGLAQAFHLGNARSREHVFGRRRLLSNPSALAAATLVVALQLAAIYFRPLASMLQTEPLGGSDLVTCLALSLVPAILGQATRLASARRRGRIPDPASR